MSFDEARQQIRRQVSEQYIGVQASVSLGELRSIRVFVLGEARNPGSYSVSSLSTITNALYVSGGIKQTGSLRNLQHKRDGKLVGTLDLYDLLLKGDSSNDNRLQPGDVIFIPSVGRRAGIEGEVYRPALYELKNENTLADLVGMAGGLTLRRTLSASILNAPTRTSSESLPRRITPQQKERVRESRRVIE